MIEALIMIIEIIGMACLGHMIVDFVSYWDTKDRIPNKPFKCDMCLTFWLGAGWFIAQWGVFGLFMAATSAILADLIFRLKERL